MPRPEFIRLKKAYIVKEFLFFGFADGVVVRLPTRIILTTEVMVG